MLSTVKWIIRSLRFLNQRLSWLMMTLTQSVARQESWTKYCTYSSEASIHDMFPPSEDVVRSSAVNRSLASRQLRARNSKSNNYSFAKARRMIILLQRRPSFFSPTCLASRTCKRPMGYVFTIVTSYPGPRAMQGTGEPLQSSPSYLNECDRDSTVSSTILSTTAGNKLFLNHSLSMHALS